MEVEQPRRSPFKECSFCKAPRETRIRLMVNPEHDCAICDVCVVALHPHAVAMYVHGNPYQTPEGKPN